MRQLIDYPVLLLKGCMQLAQDLQRKHPLDNKLRLMQSIWEFFSVEGLLLEVTEFLLKSWRTGTKIQYECYIRQWEQFCSRQKTNTYNPSMSEALEFLLQLFKTKVKGAGLGYS